MLEPPAPWLRHHPSAWRAGTLDAPRLRSTADALRQRPGFLQEVQHFAACWQAGYESHPVLPSAMRNNARYVMMVACLWLDHVRDPARPTESITQARLLAFYERLGRGLVSASPWRVKAMLGHARASGLLQPMAHVGDARWRPLEPTPALREAMAGWTAGFLRGLAPVLPLPEPPERMVQRPGLVGEVFTYRLSALLEDRYAITVGLPAMRWVTDREKGYHLFLSLMRGAALQPDGGALALVVPEELAQRSGLARNTVRNFIQACVSQGWAEAQADNRLRLTPGFVDEALHWFGLEFVWMHTLAVAAWQRLRPGWPA
ncbi:hypothetical protein D621_02410 [beta proteobacterium AAP51]|nr:hypothetical protein D621_02410 [beta proteobacterium AAP51]